MKICHCLFWIEKNKIAAVLSKDNRFEVMKFGGNCFTGYTEDFWEKWQDYAGFLKTSQTDFCLVYDDAPTISEELQHRECADKSGVWNRYTIQDAVRLLPITKPTQISNENGVCIAKVGAFRKAETTGIVNLTAKYQHAETAPAEAERKILETTPFIDEMCERLKIYDKGE